MHSIKLVFQNGADRSISIQYYCNEKYFMYDLVLYHIRSCDREVVNFHLLVIQRTIGINDPSRWIDRKSIIYVSLNEFKV